MTRRRTAMVVAVLLLLGAGAAVLARSRPQCGDEWGAVVQGVSDPALRPIEDLRSTDPFYADYADLIDDAQEFGAPFGALRSASPGAVIGNDSPLMPVGDDVVIRSGAGPLGYGNEARMVDLSSGDVVWTRTYEARTLAGGLAGGSFVSLVRPSGDNRVLRAPVMTAFDPVDGSMTACGTVGGDVSPADVTDDAKVHVVHRLGDEFLVVLPRETDDVREDTHGTALSLSRVAPTTGETTWTVELDPDVIDNAGDLDVIDDVVLLSTVDATDRTVFLGLFASGPGSPDADPKVVAYSTDDGHQLWAFPEATNASELVYVNVVGTDPETGIIVIESGKWVESSDYPYVLDRTLTAVDVAGEVLWSTTVTDTGNPQPDFATVLGSTVMVHPYAEDDRRLYAWDVTDGSEVWSEPIDVYLSWADAAQVDDLWLVPWNFGIHVIDPTTGLAGTYDLQGRTKQIVVTDEHIVLRTYDRLLVFDRQGLS